MKSRFMEWICVQNLYYRFIELQRRRLTEFEILICERHAYRNRAAADFFLKESAISRTVKRLESCCMARAEKRDSFWGSLLEHTGIQDRKWCPGRCLVNVIWYTQCSTESVNTVRRPHTAERYELYPANYTRYEIHSDCFTVHPLDCFWSQFGSTTSIMIIALSLAMPHIAEAHPIMRSTAEQIRAAGLADCKLQRLVREAKQI